VGYVNCTSKGYAMKIVAFIFVKVLATLGLFGVLLLFIHMVMDWAFHKNMDCLLLSLKDIKFFLKEIATKYGE